jgi:hypothetical protein
METNLKVDIYAKFTIHEFSENSFVLRYMNSMGNYSKIFSDNCRFWKENSIFFHNDFKKFKNILELCLFSEHTALNYNIFNQTIKTVSLYIIHDSDILDFQIPIILENELEKIKLYEEKIFNLEEQLKNEKIETERLRNIINDGGEKCVYFYNAPDSDREYSSIFSDSKIGNKYSQSMIDSPSCWSAKISDKNQWMIIDLREKKQMRGFIIMGRYNYKHAQQVTKLSFLFSDDKENWYEAGDYECKSINQNELDSNFLNPKKNVRFDQQIVGRYIKIIPIEWENHISLRFGLLLKNV